MRKDGCAPPPPVFVIVRVVEAVQQQTMWLFGRCLVLLAVCFVDMPVEEESCYSQVLQPGTNIRSLRL